MPDCLESVEPDPSFANDGDLLTQSSLASLQLEAELILVGKIYAADLGRVGGKRYCNVAVDEGRFW